MLFIPSLKQCLAQTYPDADHNSGPNINLNHSVAVFLLTLYSYLFCMLHVVVVFCTFAFYNLLLIAANANVNVQHYLQCMMHYECRWCNIGGRCHKPNLSFVTDDNPITKP